MSNSFNSYFFGGVVFNTFIGGISGVVTSDSELATLLGISVGTITEFNINGSDVEAFITSSYSLPDDTFNNDGGVNDWGDGDILTHYIDTDNLVTLLGATSMRNQTNMNYIELSGVLTLKTGALRDTNLLVARFSACTATEGTIFQDCKRLEYVYLPLCTDLGGTTGDDLVFVDSTRLRSVYVNTTLETIQGGSPDGDLDYVETLDRGTVFFIANSTVPSDITDLAADTVYSDGINIDWTAPSSTNTIDFYEIYLDDVFFKVDYYEYRTFIDLTNSVTFKFTVRVIDIYGNRSDFSNELSQNINGANAIVQGNLISYYRKDLTVFDEFYLNESPTVPAGVSFVAGQSDEAAAHIPPTSITNLGADSSLDLTQGSISLWLKTSSPGSGFRGVVIKQLAYGLFVNANVLGLFSWGSPTGFKTTGVSVNDGVYRHLVLTFDDGITNGTKIYIDGSLSLTTTMAVSAQTVNCVIGGGSPTIQGITADVDGVGIYDTILTSTQVTTIFNLQNAGNELI